MTSLSKFATLILVLGIASCSADKAPEENNVTETEFANIELYLTSRESTDSTLCSMDSALKSNCGIEDFYFTLNGNVIQRNWCEGESEAAWTIGKYRIGDTGIVCQMDKIYIVRKNDSTSGNSNGGSYFSLENKEPFLLKKSACKNVSFTKQYSSLQTEDIFKKRDLRVFGRIYFEDNKRKDLMLTELRKVKSLAKL